jgi:hypothetical protein
MRDEVVHVRADDLVCVDEDDFVEGEGKRTSRKRIL